MFDRADQAQLADLGISPAEVERQLRIFTDPPPAIVLDRPCTVGDGIDALDDAERRSALQGHAESAAAGRLMKFVPASGAATRMFQALLTVRQRRTELSREALQARAARNDEDAKAVLELADNLPRFAFAELLRAAVAQRGGDLAALIRRGELAPIIDALLDLQGLDYSALPKALILFHRYGDESRTAFEEHLLEGATYARSAAGKAVLHFTVSPEHDDAYRSVLAQVRQRCEANARAQLDIGFSHQKRATDTIAVDLDNRPLRNADGRLVVRPGGHGALIENLNDLRGDIVLLKTIDNIQPDHLRAATTEWLRLLSGHLVALQRVIFEHSTALNGASPSTLQVDAARAFARDTLGAALSAHADAKTVAAALDRPLRVAGMVRNSGEPGGGPFWVRDAAGTCTRQIVESAQVDMKNPAQRAIFESSTHFNPVLIVCGVRDGRGRPFDLREFVDPAAVFIARKSKDGQELKALERPGLWNGAMAHWHTLFVELPDATFTPVKTVNDLLRLAHQPPQSTPHTSAAAAH